MKIVSHFLTLVLFLLLTSFTQWSKCITQITRDVHLTLLANTIHDTNMSELENGNPYGAGDVVNDNVNDNVNTDNVNNVNNEPIVNLEENENLPEASENSVNNEPTVNPEDSVSHVSNRSTTSSIRLKNKQKEIELKLELHVEALHEINEIEEEKLKLQRRTEELQRKQKEVSLRAKLHAVREMNRVLEEESDPEVTFKPPVTSASPVAKETNSSKAFVPPVTLTGPDVKETQSFTCNNTDVMSVFNRLVENQRDQVLPNHEIKYFDGSDILLFQTFKRNFELVVERNTKDPTRRLEFLLKYTRGEAHDLIQYCPLIDPPQKACERAKTLLIRDYGDPPIIAAAFMKQIEQWPRISSGDKAGLRKFSIFLNHCVNSKENNSDMNCMDDFDFIRSFLFKITNSSSTEVNFTSW
ncbi:uncharacterized protein LOC126816465 [Patella vulgata]|uniref:uncharacterized protein LOC126816465 n=1 Tax=Patella vulgata TaxID=6465 RepID=UPI00217FFC37|nr:uncharacterized protein LOC126816465 [Patella vulgata]